MAEQNSNKSEELGVGSQAGSGGVPRYQIRLAAKIPSTWEKYRMLEASITVSGDNFEECHKKVQEALAIEIANVCILMHEMPPAELYDTLKKVWPGENKEEFIDDLYQKSEEYTNAL